MNLYDSDEKRWNAVRTRNPAGDGAFVYGVRTTGIYCRTSCSSKPAKRKNICFFDTPHEAEAAGFRACKRCRPDQLTKNPHGKAIMQACSEIQTSEHEPDLATLARRAALSPGHFQRLFKAQVGLSPKRYAMAVRKQRFRDALSNAASVTDAIYDAGYNSSSRAYDKGGAGFAAGMTPGSCQKGGIGEKIRYASATSSLGNIWVAATERGICMIEFGSRKDFVANLITRFPHADCKPADQDLTSLVAAVVSLIDAPTENAALPLDIRGTAFQERVWQALRKIPLGHTVSYSELAEIIGQPTAARAVARACATNIIALAIPCHRAVRKSGEISGYKWGVSRKRALIERERD